MNPPSAFQTHLKDGLAVAVRPITSKDRENIARAFDSLSDETRYHRFWIRAKQLNPGLMDRLVDTDSADHIAWAVVPLLGDDPPGYGAASFWRSPTEGATAEFSITVADAWQDQGVGTLLLATLWRHALSIGIRQFIGHVLPSNLPMRSWMESLGASAIHDERQWTYHLQLDTDLLNESSASTRLRQVLASVPSLGEH